MRGSLGAVLRPASEPEADDNQRMPAAPRTGQNKSDYSQPPPSVYPLSLDLSILADRETKFSGADGDRDREIFIFPVQLTTSRIGNLTQLILLLLHVMTIHTYIPKKDEANK